MESPSPKCPHCGAAMVPLDVMDVEDAADFGADVLACEEGCEAPFFPFPTEEEEGWVDFCPNGCLPPDQTVPLSTLKGLAHRIAEAMVKEHGVYYCMVDGVRTKVVAGALVLLALSGCVTVTVAPPAPHGCDWLNHSGVCETYAPVTNPYPELLKRDPGGDIDLGHHVYPHLNDPHTPRT